jgi:hypothetical protein
VNSAVRVNAARSGILASVSLSAGGCSTAW